VGRQSGRDQVFFDRVDMYPIINFGQVSPDVPSELSVFLVLKPLELLDKVELKLRRYPRGELKSDVLVGIRSSLPPRFGDNPDRLCGRDPSLWRGQSSCFRLRF